MNEIKTYQDFISEVKNLVKDDKIDISGEIPKNVNENFQFKDIKAGKLYVFWQSRRERLGVGHQRTWIIYPFDITVRLGDEPDYSVYWCYYERGVIGMMSDVSSQKDKKGWSYVWAKKRWQLVADKTFFKDKFINWNKEPWSDLK